MLKKKTDLSRGSHPFKQIEHHIEAILRLLGEDPNRQGLRYTPRRYAKSLKFLLSGSQVSTEETVGQALFQESIRGMVIIRDIEFFSLCEHHLLPFFGKAHIAYIPDQKIIGLSKIPRILDSFARRLQIQERLTQQVAEALQQVLNPKGLGVMIDAEHLCMKMRGVKKQQSRTRSHAFLGDLTKYRYQSQFMHQIFRS